MPGIVSQQVLRSRCATLSAVLSVGLACAPLQNLLALSVEDRTFADFLLRDVKYYDVAMRWLADLEKSSGITQTDLADIASYRIDILKGQGDEAGSAKLREEFQRRFPNHARSSLKNLEDLEARMKGILDQFNRATVEPDKTKAEALRKSAQETFLEEISKPLDALIVGIETKIKEARGKSVAETGAADGKKKRAKPQSRSKEILELERSLQYTELSRIQYLLTYARRLASGSPEKTQILAKGRELAETFVSKRGDYPVMQYEAQLHLGLFAYEAGQYAEADEALNPIYDADPPFTKHTVTLFKGIRLKAILFGCKAAAAAGDHAKSVQIIKNSFLKPRDDALAFAKEERDPELKALSVLVRLEYGIALAGSGQPQQGLDEIQGIISQPGQNPAFVTDARRALGRIATMGSVRLRARDYYEAAVGLKSALEFEDALNTFQTALGAVSSRNRKELAEVAPLCLNEIGQINFLLERYVESALSYQEICERFSTAPEEILSPAATNFLAATNKALKADNRGTKHVGLASLKEQATRFSERFSKGFAVLENYMFEGRTLESQGKWKEAHEKYLQVAPELKGRKTPFYWQAQSRAWACISKLWEGTAEADRAALEGDILKAITALKEIVPQAVKDHDKSGAAVAALTLGSIHYQRREWAEATAALKVFTTDLANEEAYRCSGLCSLIFAEVRTDDFAAAEKHFVELQKFCQDSPLTANAAQAISLAYQEKKRLDAAAPYALIYAEHPTSKAELEKPQEIIRVARVLVEGGLTKEGLKLGERLRSAPREEDLDVDRELLVLSAKSHLVAKDWNKAIATLEAYVSKYSPQEDQHYDDAYLLHDLGRAYLARGGNKPQVKHLRDASGAYNKACFVMRQRAKREPSLNKVFVTWMEEFLSVKFALGEAGNRNAFRQIVAFVENAKEEGPETYTDRLRELAEKSASRLQVDDAVKPNRAKPSQ